MEAGISTDIVYKTTRFHTASNASSLHTSIHTTIPAFTWLPMSTEQTRADATRSSHHWTHFPWGEYFYYPLTSSRLCLFPFSWYSVQMRCCTCAVLLRILTRCVKASVRVFARETKLFSPSESMKFDLLPFENHNQRICTISSTTFHQSMWRISRSEIKLYGILLQCKSIRWITLEHFQP